MSTHARLSASSSARWLNCTPSAKLAEQFPDTGSVHAEGGTLAHAIGELKARNYFMGKPSARSYSAAMKKLKSIPCYDKGMDGATDAYLDYLKELAMSFGDTPPFVALENRVDYSDYAPEGFGTADCLMIGGGRLCVCDYKNGAGVVVEAENNSQMMLYALGALKLYAPIYGGSIENIHLTIIQPNAGGVKEWSLTRSELEAWGETVVKPAAALAYEGKGEFRPGPWCDKNFCPARAQCTARAQKFLELETVKDGCPDGDPADTGAPLLSNEEIGSVLVRGLELEAWVKSLKGYVEKALLSGLSVPGWKLVEGRSSRDWHGGYESAFEALQKRGVDQALLWKREPVTPPALEKVRGKKVYTETAADLVDRLPGKPALAQESDKRPAYNAAQTAFQKTEA